MAINAARPRAVTDGSQTGIVDTEMPVTHGDLLKYDASKKMYIPAPSGAFSLSDFVNDINIISLADVNSAIDAHAIAGASNGDAIDLSSYATDAEVQSLFTAYVPVIDYTNVTNTPSLASYATSAYVDQQVAAVDVFSGNFADLIGTPTIFSGSYSDLLNVPIIPSIAGLSTIAYVDQQIAAVTHPVTDLSAHALISSLPTDVNELTDTTGLLTTDLSAHSTIAYVDQQIANISGTNLSDYVTSTSLTTSLASYALATGLFSGDYTDLTNVPQDLVTTGHLTNTLASYQPSIDLSGYALISSIFSGDYTELTNKPTVFSGNFADLIGTPTIFSGSYTDLTDQPIIPSIAGLSTIAYVDQQIANVAGGGIIDLSSYVTDVELATSLAAYQPTVDLSSYATTTSVDTAIAAIVHPTIPADVSDLTDTTGLLDASGGGSVDFTGYATETYVTNALSSAAIASISALDDLNDVAIDGTETVTHALMFNSLSGMWENVDLTENWASKDYVTAQLTAFSTDGTIDLEGYASETWVDQRILERGPHFSGDYNALVNSPNLFSGDYNDLYNTPASQAADLSFTLSGNTLALSNGNDIDLSALALDYSTFVNTPTLFTGNYNDLVNLPNLFSGNYLDLTNKPYIPSIAGLASEDFVNNLHAEPDITGDRNFTHNVEFRADIRQVASGVSTTAQKRDVVFAIKTTDAIETEVSFSDSTYITLSDNTTAKFTATYVATSGTVHDSFKVTGIVHKMAGNLVAIGNNSYEVTQDSISGHTGSVSVDAINDRMTVTVQGSSDTTVDWVVFVELTEVTR